MSEVEAHARMPNRPAVSPLLYALATSAIVCHAVMAAGGMLPALVEAAQALRGAWPLIAFVAAVVFGAVLWAKRGGAFAFASSRPRVKLIVPTAVLVCVCAALSALTATLAVGEGEAFSRAMAEGSLASWELTVTSDPTMTSRGAWRARAHACASGKPAGDLWLMADARFEIGDVVYVNDGFVPNSDDEWGRINRAQGVWGRVMPRGAVRVSGPRGIMAAIRSLRDAARLVIDPYRSEGRAILAGCVIGDRRAMDAMGLDEVFSACGVSHLIAVSGGHIVIMAQILGIMLDRTRLRPWARLSLLVALSGLYVLLTGAPTPATRSWVMSTVTYGSVIVGRRSDSLSAVSLVGLAMVLFDPSCVGQMGFLLSVVCVGCLCLFAGYASYVLDVATRLPARRHRVSRRFSRRAENLRRATCETLGATCVAQLATMPVTVPVFMQLSLVAPLANLLLTLPFTLLIGIGLVAACLPLPAVVSSAMLASCDVVSTVVMLLLRLVASLPFASIPFSLDATVAAVASVAVAMALLVAWPRLTRARAVSAVAAILAIAGVYLLRWGVFAPARIVVLDIGQGDAILVQDGRSAILVDAGPDDAIRAALARNHVLRLDAVVVTHLHADHYGGITSLPGFVSVDSVIVARGVVGSDAASGYESSAMAELRSAVAALTGNETATTVARGSSLHVGDFELRVVWPTSAVDGTTNADSIELLLAYGNDATPLSALLTGDAERDETGAVLASGELGHVDVLKVGHHGSAVSIDDACARALTPLVAIASAGEGNRYGHPTDDCVSTLEGVGTLFLCTKDVGDVCVVPARDGPVVSCQRDGWHPG